MECLLEHLQQRLRGQLIQRGLEGEQLEYVATETITFCQDMKCRDLQMALNVALRINQAYCKGKEERHPASSAPSDVPPALDRLSRVTELITQGREGYFGPSVSGLVILIRERQARRTEVLKW